MKRNKSLTRNIFDDEPSPRASRFLLHEALNNPVTSKDPYAPIMPDSTFVADFHKQYSRLPATYKNHPVDQGVEIIKIGIMAKLCDELKLLTQELKAKLAA
jgi:hypothetical protein